MGKTTIDVKQRPHNCYGTSAPIYSTFKSYFTEFRHDLSGRNGVQISKRSKEAVTSKYNAKLWKF